MNDLLWAVSATLLVALAVVAVRGLVRGWRRAWADRKPSSPSGR
jgi:hypothetical protein